MWSKGTWGPITTGKGHQTSGRLDKIAELITVATINEDWRFIRGHHFIYRDLLFFLIRDKLTWTMCIVAALWILLLSPDAPEERRLLCQRGAKYGERKRSSSTGQRRRPLRWDNADIIFGLFERKRTQWNRNSNDVHKKENWADETPSNSVSPRTLRTYWASAEISWK